MTSHSLQSFYAASAGVAGALIGLLFVAISVARERLSATDEEPEHQIRAAAAMTSFTNTLAVSLFTLIEGQRSGTAAAVLAAVGLLFVIASVLSLRHELRKLRDVLFLVTLAIGFIAQLIYGLRVSAHPGDIGAQQTVAAIVVVLCMVGIARSWALIDGPSIGIGHELGTVVLQAAKARHPSDRDGAHE